ncbi:HNH/endonuclease VII fold putative polymorphic toxin [Bacillus pseudomycoides]|uniref:HNH/endonuclease VII fold putative polymorphic toxin n=1 Tax=Bacillus pseudomycoides TaxID=64104 RepID=UPI000BF34DAA|nr:HNH/endonuclease VII fold putative polymorphic toxin [Bacillus pseudomycoides]PEP88348.1 hypothetical protein CN584_00435 [Bacillus pseudomycoides]
MNLNMHLGEVQSQTQSMNAVCTATIQGMEQAIQSIDALVSDEMLKGQTYDSAKTFFSQTFYPLAQGIIYLCEELIRQNDAFPNNFESQVASTDVIEQELREQIREIDRMKASMEVISQAMPIPGMDAMANLFTVMRHKLQEKLDHLYQFNQTSSNNYSTAIQLAASIATGLAEVQSGKGFNPASGTFSTQGLNMEWTASIQVIMDERDHQAEIKEITLQEQQAALQEQEDNRPWYEKTAIRAWEFFQGVSNSAAENFSGRELPMGDELENKTTFQAGNLVGNVVSGVLSVAECLGGIAIIGGSNVGTFILEVGTAGFASPIVLPADVALTAAGSGFVTHGGFVWYNTIQNSMDTLQKFQSSSPHGRVSKVKGTSNTTTVNVSRKGAFNKAKSDAGIPRVQHPEKIERVPMRTADHEGGHVIKDSNGKVIYTKEYHFTNKDGKKVIIQDHSAGHSKGGQGPHFNVRPADKPRTGKFEGTQEHYPFNK